MKKLLITGSTGYLARLVALYNREHFDITLIGRRDVDFADTEALCRYLDGLDFDYVFHTVARAQTADCEADPEGTALVNVKGAKAVASVAQAKGARPIMISTEQVFGGAREGAPFAEDAEPCPNTVYGQHKAEVDAWLADSGIDHVTLRLSWMMGLAMPGVRPSPNIAGNVLRALRTTTPTAFTLHEHRGLTYAQRLADQFARIVELPSGVYNFTDVNDLSTYDSARHVARAMGASDEEVAALILPDREKYADAPKDVRLDPAKIRAAGIGTGTFEEGVDLMLRDFGWK